jgi:hypothetical protein
MRVAGRPIRELNIEGGAAVASNESSESKWRMGFYPGPPQIRMEEEEGPSPQTPDYGRAEIVDEVAKEAIGELLRQRARIIDAMDVASLTAEDKFKLLEDTRLMMSKLYGGDSTKFSTEKVIYSILTFSGVVIVVLALLTSFQKLPVEVTTTFVGTVVGGTIATIAQKLGKVGR